MDSLETDRFILRPFVSDDGPKLHTVIGNDADMTWDATARPIERTEQTLLGRIKHYKDHGFGLWAVIDKKSGEMIGETGLQVLEGSTDVELVVYTAKKHWHHGAGFETCIAALTYGFTEMNLSRIVAATRTYNTAAQKLLEKLGFRFINESVAYGDPVFYYELMKPEFTQKNQLYKIVYGEHSEPRFDFSKSNDVYY